MRTYVFHDENDFVIISVIAEDHKEAMGLASDKGVDHETLFYSFSDDE